MALNSIIEINGKKVGNGHRPYIICEMACAHNGKFDYVKKLSDAAAEAKADAIQLQFFVPEHTVTPHHEAFKTLQEIAFSKDEWKELFDYSKSLGLDVWVCAYDHVSVDWAVDLGADGIKLNSADLANPQVIEKVAASKIPFTLGTGASKISEIKEGILIAENAGAENIILMHGVQNFPTKIEDLNISRLRLLKREFPDMAVGYADHTSGDDEFAMLSDLVAVGLEANLIEKHITLSRSEEGIDYQAALEPSEYTKFVERIHKAYLAFGTDQEQEFTESDLKYRKFQKKSIVLASDLSKGHIISKDDLVFLRNDIPGVSPTYVDRFINRTLIKDMKKYSNLTDDCIN